MKQDTLRASGPGSRALSLRLQARDDAALRELYQQEKNRAFALALRVVGEAAAAEDAVQEAFTQLWEQAPRLDPDGGRIESLLMTMVHRRAIDITRRRKRHAASLPDAELLQQIDEQASAMLDRVEESLTAAVLQVELQAALASLPSEQRQVVTQAYVEERSLREIAEHECLPLGTVKSRLRLAMAKLSESMRTRALP